MGYSGNELKLAKNYVGEQIVQKATNSPVETLSFDGGIYSLPSNVVNGQVSAIVKGVTRTNLATVNEVTITDKDVFVCDIELVAGKTYTLSALVDAKKSTSGTGVYKIRINDVTPTYFAGSGVGSGNSGYSEITFTALLTGTHTIEATSNLDGLSATEEKYFKEILLEETDIRKRFISGGTKSTLNARLVSVGKNLFDGELEQGEILSTTGENVDSSVVIRSKNYIPVNGGSTYTISRSISTSGFGTRYYDKDYNYLGMGATMATGVTQTTTTLDQNVAYVRLRDISNDLSAKYQIEKGGTATEYEPYKESTVNLNTGGELRSVPNGVKDEVSISEGKVTLNTKKKILEASDIDTLVTSGTNVDAVNIKKPLDYISYDEYNMELNFELDGYITSNFSYGERDDIANIGKISSNVNEIVFSLVIEKGKYADLASAQADLAGTMLTYQLASPVVTNFTPQKLEVFERGTVYVEPLGALEETTYPTVELEVPVGQGNQFGIATHDYEGASADWVLSTNEAKSIFLSVTNAGAAANIIAPDKGGRAFIVTNNSGYGITIKKAGGTGVTVTNGKTVWVIHDGTDYTAITAEV